MDSTALTKMDQPAMMQRIDAARFPQELKPEDKKLLAMVAVTYGFDPLMGEITIYQGRPYVSIDGRYRKAQETGNLVGVKTRPATKEEYEAWRIPEDDYFFHCDVFIKGGGLNSFEGWGRVRLAETKPGSTRQGDTTSTYKPIQGNPQRMAEKRAEAFALRKAFHINLPSIEDVGTVDEDSGVTVDIETGEIIDGEIVQSDIAQAEADSAEYFPPDGESTASASTTPEPPVTKISLITKVQTNRITELIGQTGYTGDAVRAYTMEKYGKDSSIKLTKQEANELIRAIGDFKIAK